jgi:hypothetical protein
MVAFAKKTAMFFVFVPDGANVIAGQIKLKEGVY